MESKELEVVSDDFHRGEERAYTPTIGDWFWLKTTEGEHLTCVTRVGSNYVKLTGVNGDSYRRHFDIFWKCVKRELNPDKVIEERVHTTQERTKRLLVRVHNLTKRLAVNPNPAIPQAVPDSSMALTVVSSTESVDEYKLALVKARDEDLPELFKKIEVSNKKMAQWMAAKAIPLQALADDMEGVIDEVKLRVSSVELYAGIKEEVRLLRRGRPAGPENKVHVMQRRHYMDEECLANYSTGGMEFREIGEFESWLCKNENFERIFPHEKCIVAFRVRRQHKERHPVSLADFISMRFDYEMDKKTFLYVRNGRRLYGISTDIEFDENLFPDKEKNHLLNGEEVWIKSWGHLREDDIISDGEYQELVRRDEQEKEEDGYCFNRSREFHRYSPKSVYYDDASKVIGKMITGHNKFMVVLQGLLDRSEMFHPHPPWQLSTKEGFEAAVKLVYDNSRVLASGETADFEEYRARLNSSIAVGTVTFGQEDVWERREGARQTEKERNRSWGRYPHPGWKKYRPEGDPGPGKFAKVARLQKGKCKFEWIRGKRSASWERRDDRVKDSIWVPKGKLINVDAYKPGDYHIFFDDPRTRAEYLQWAPYLLECEEYYAGNRVLGPDPKETLTWGEIDESA